MSRIRTIRPEFFRHEILAELPYPARIVFEGLWCIADREGRLEDRPKRIKLDVLPFDDEDVDDLLEQLAEKGFIIRYRIDDRAYILINSFTKHQSPHPKEPISVIPPPSPDSVIDKQPASNLPVSYGEAASQRQESDRQALSNAGSSLTGVSLTGPSGSSLTGSSERVDTVAAVVPIARTTARPPAREEVPTPANVDSSSSAAAQPIELDQSERGILGVLLEALPHVRNESGQEGHLRLLVREYPGVDLRFEAARCLSHYPQGRSDWSRTFCSWVINARSVRLLDGSCGPPRLGMTGQRDPPGEKWGMVSGPAMGIGTAEDDELSRISIEAFYRRRQARAEAQEQQG